MDFWHDSPLAEMFEKQKKLFALCSKHGLKREAYSIIFGEEMPERPRRRVGRPKEKDEDYRITLKLGMAGGFLRKPEVRGDRTRFADAMAREVLGRRNNSRPTEKEVRALAKQLQNDISQIPLEELAMVVYVIRRMDLGESLDQIFEILRGADSGNKEAIRELEVRIRETIPDMARRLVSHKKAEI